MDSTTTQCCRPRLAQRLIAGMVLTLVASLTMTGVSTADAIATNQAEALTMAALEEIGSGTQPKISDNGRFVVWLGTEPTAVPSRPPSQVYLHDRDTGTTVLVSQANGVAGNENSRDPQVSNDGRYVAFSSLATNLDPSDTDEFEDIYLADMAAGTLSDISGDDEEASHVKPLLSGDGSVLIYNTENGFIAGDDFCGYDWIVHHKIVSAPAPFTTPSWSLLQDTSVMATALDYSGEVVGYAIETVEGSHCDYFRISDYSATAGTHTFVAEDGRNWYDENHIAAMSSDGRTAVVSHYLNDRLFERVIDLPSQTILYEIDGTYRAQAIDNDRTTLLSTTGMIDLASATTYPFPAGVWLTDMSADGGAVVGSTTAKKIVIADPSRECKGQPATIIGAGTVGGTPGDDVIIGSNGPDDIRGFGGNDTICALDGDDIIRGSAGDDVVSGGKGDDQIFAGTGADQVFADAGDDTIYGGSGDDIIHGGRGHDTIRAGSDDDQVFAGPDDDIVNGDNGGDELYGEDGDDQLDGGANDDLLVGGPGADDVVGGWGKDSVTYIDAAGPVNVSLDGTANDGQSGEGDNIEASIETIIGSQFDDTIVGSNGANILRGLGGDDLIRGGGGADTLYGGAGDDELRGGGGADGIDGGSGSNFCRGGGAIDQFLRCQTAIQ